MAKAPFTISKAPDLSSGAANPAAGLMQAYNWGGVQTDAHVLVGGGAKKTDDENVNKLLAVAEDLENDEYISNVVSYSDDGTVTQSKLRNLSDSREFMTVAPMLNCVLFAGGQDEKGFSRVVEMYDSFGGHKILTPLDVARTDMASAGLAVEPHDFSRVECQALYEPKTEQEFVDVTYKIANVYIPTVEQGQVVPSDEKIEVKDALSLMPDIPCEFVGESNSSANEVELTDYEWHDKVVKGSKYRLALPDNTTERTQDYEFGGYYSDVNCENKLENVIDELNENMTVYMKFVAKSEVALPTEELTETHNITFEVDGFAADTDVPSGGMMPPDMELPDATAIEPVDVDHEAFPDLFEEFMPTEMPAAEGFRFVRWYFYDADGNKVNYVPDETPITQDMVLHPEFEMVDLDAKTTVKLVELTPDMPLLKTYKKL